MGEDRQTDSTQRATHWGLTINNPTADDRVKLKTNPRWLRLIRGQDEIGKTGTLHCQIYIHTDQVRWSAIKDWMPRANISVLKTKLHIDNMKQYVWKDDETTVADTKWEKDYKGEAQALTFADVMGMMAYHAYPSQEIQRLLTAPAPGTPAICKNFTEAYTQEFWGIVNILLYDDPNLVGLLTQPQYMRSWINTRRVWIKLCSTNIQCPDAPPALPLSPAETTQPWPEEAPPVGPELNEIVEPPHHS